MTDRRRFLLGAAAAVGASATANAQKPEAQSARTKNYPPDVLRCPDRAWAFFQDGSVALTKSGANWSASGIEISSSPRTGRGRRAELPIEISAPGKRIKRVHLRWHGSFPDGFRYLGDHWERSYGDLEWRGLAGERWMPWYFLASDGRTTHGYGVKTHAAAICWWQVDAGGVSLWLDVSNGGLGTELGDRRLTAATVVTRYGSPGESSHSAAQAFCRMLCDQPRLPAEPVYGSNNWYYAYGMNTSAESILRDAALMAELVSPDEKNRPFVVIDMGWGATPEGAGPSKNVAREYGDMSKLAANMKAKGTRPGIWTRPLLTTGSDAEKWRIQRRIAANAKTASLITLDPTIPEAREYIAQNVSILSQWGFELIKHDFSTYDLTGRWGFQMGPEFTDSGWHFHDRSKTTAEITLDLYRTIRQAAGKSLLIGCNTVGHFGAGLFELQRIGDDTSGREWSRTRKMGVNTLAFRIAQHDTFFAADADCVPFTKAIPWELTRQWLELVARSGTALFVSVDPAALEESQRPALKAALAQAAQAQTQAIPLDWMDTTTPERWLLDGKPRKFGWYETE